MKKFFMTAAIIGATLTAGFAQETARVETKSFESEYFPFPREIFIYTPDSYDEATENDYDVIYVFDSQHRSRFDLVHSLMHYGIQQDEENPLSYIVVGITSPDIPEYNHYRDLDFLPQPKHSEIEYGPYNSANFKKFLKNEVIPYINDNYRSTHHSLAVGHSLGASFVLDELMTEDMFDDYIALSPNLAWDEDRFAKDLIDYHFNPAKPRFIYMTMANESENTGWPSEWRPAWDKVKNHFENPELPDNVKMTIKEYPEYSHNTSYHHALTDALQDYAAYCHDYSAGDTTLYPVHLEVSAVRLDGDVYVTGNQPALADWNPEGVKMTKIADNTYALDLELTLPAEFKFTQGSWETQLFMKNATGGNLRITDPERADKHYRAYTFD